MSVWTRIAEILSDVGDSIAAALHKLVGAGNTAPENSLAFTIGMIALGAKMAKADGVVTGSEVKAFRQIFHVPPHELLHVARVFDLAKQFLLYPAHLLTYHPSKTQLTRLDYYT